MKWIGRLAVAVFGAGTASITFGITYWMTFGENVTPDPVSNGGDPVGDPRFITVAQRMFIAVFVGFVLLCVSSYLFRRSKPKASLNP